MNEKSFVNVLVCKGLSHDDVGVAWGIVFQEIRPVSQLISKPAISLKKCWGGYRSKTHSFQR